MRGWSARRASETAAGVSRISILPHRVVARSDTRSAGGLVLIKHFDHVTVVVTDVERAKRFFGALGFVVDKSVVISGRAMAEYMGVENIEAEHHTLVLKGGTPRLEVQLLKYFKPDPIPDPDIRTLRQVGFNHICFAVDDLASLLGELVLQGFQPRNTIMNFHDRKLVFLQGPDDITVELAEWSR